MEKVNKSQMLKLLVIASLLITTPLLSTSHRSKYLYFILNILILLVGAESGLLSFFLDSSLQNNKIAFSDFSAADNHNEQKTNTSIIPADTDNKVVEKHNCSDKMNVGGVVKTPPTTPSIFFIEGGDEDDASCHNEEEREKEEREEVEEELLFEKAEMFIGNFYKQLKMQREESWKKLHDIYHKTV